MLIKINILLINVLFSMSYMTWPYLNKYKPNCLATFKSALIDHSAMYNFLFMAYTYHTTIKNKQTDGKVNVFSSSSLHLDNGVYFYLYVTC